MNIDPQMIQALMQSGSNDPQAARLKRQQMQADQMRQSGMQGMMNPDGQMVGGRYIPNTANMIGSAAQMFMGGRMQPDIDKGMSEMNTRNADAKSKYLEAMMMGLRKNYPQQPQPMLPPDGMEDQ
jgi:hypothetical protein